MNDTMVWNFSLTISGAEVKIPVVANSHQEALERLAKAIGLATVIDLTDLEGEIRPQKRLILPCEYMMKVKVRSLNDGFVKRFLDSVQSVFKPRN